MNNKDYIFSIVIKKIKLKLLPTVNIILHIITSNPELKIFQDWSILSFLQKTFSRSKTKTIIKENDLV